MKLALITTTIYVPRVLSLCREFSKEVMFFIAGDRKTPHDEVHSFVSTLGNAIYYSDEDQDKLGYSCSEIIGWNKIMRRNIALLEAIKYGADIIITIDDDNIPLSHDYFEVFESILTSPYNGPMASSETHWFNVGEFINPPVYHRGFPYDYRHIDLKVRLLPVRNAKVGVAAGLWLGDPDIDAMERITNRPTAYHLSEILRTGLLVDNTCFTPFNSQNTAYVAELAPLMMVWVGVGRYDDIWASYIAQRVMMETEYHVHFGRPFVWQERNPQNLWRNLKDEIYGMEYTTKFCEDLLAANLGEGSILDKLNRLYEHLRAADYLPPVVYELGKLWCKDMEKVLR
ncbi:MAG TPA: hypothetical protein PLJ78_04420 [Anaerolineae bacterium]|mgnify:CR=1 FL=1|nr:hypothetical protein [Anaerolineae bacterium]HQK13177.1 hypothetical protein [Anaerolineae bacterium]